MTATSESKKVLIIVHMPRASPRVFGLARFLPEFGWQPIILTGTMGRHATSPARIVETRYRNALGFSGNTLGVGGRSDIRQARVGSGRGLVDIVSSMAGEVINYPCPDKNWKPLALKAAVELFEKEDISAIISSSPPVISHIIASELKSRHNITWIADLRDLWSLNSNYKYSGFRRALDQRLEVKTLAQADALVTVSAPLADKLKALHQGKPVYAVSSGFDPMESAARADKLTSKFTLTYTGSIYPGKQNPAKLLIALHDLISDGSLNQQDLEVRFFGPELPWLDKEIDHYNLTHIAVQSGSVPLAEALEKQRESQALILFDWEDPEEIGVYTGKVFEYLGARRPILSVGGVAGNVVDKLLAETGAGVHAPDVEAIKKVLKNMYLDYKSTGKAAYHGVESAVDKYSQRAMVKRFAEILRRPSGASV